jgi:hypothetical protein
LINIAFWRQLGWQARKNWFKLAPLRKEKRIRHSWARRKLDCWQQLNQARAPRKFSSLRGGGGDVCVCVCKFWDALKALRARRKVSS